MIYIVNTPARVPEPSPTHGNYHWTFERLISAGIVPLTMAPFIGGSLNPLMDGVFCAALLAHSHIGWDAMITDYFPRWRVPKIRALLEWTLRIATVLVGVGLYEFETSMWNLWISSTGSQANFATDDVGVTEAIKRIWKA